MKNYILYPISAIVIAVIALTLSCGGSSKDPVAVAGVTLSRDSLTLTSGQQEQLGATVEPEDAADKTVSWRSTDTNKAMVSSDGVVTALVPGSVTIIATTRDGGKTALCNVTVVSTDIAVTGVTLDIANMSIASGTQQTIAATVLPAGATNKNVMWTSTNTLVASVRTDGVVTALNPGSAAIIVSTQDGGKTAVCSVEVTPNSLIYVQSVTLSKASLTLAVGDEETLEAIVRPDNATDKFVTWFSSNQEVAMVTQTGTVTALKAGEAMIFVSTRDGSKTNGCNLTVTNTTIPATGVTLDKTTLTLLPGETDTIRATVTPANATNKEIQWSSSNSLVAQVSQTGVVTAISPGVILIVASTKDGGIIAICNVTVVDEHVSVTNIELDVSELTLGVGYIRALVPIISPANATNKAVMWASQHPSIATVNQNGTITALRPGETSIIATAVDGGRSVACALTVIQTSVPVSGVTLTTKNLTLAPDDEFQLNAVVSPSTATNKGLIWLSSNAEVATVSSTGNVKAIAQGYAVIIVSTQEGGFVDYCVISVI